MVGATHTKKMNGYAPVHYHWPPEAEQYVREQWGKMPSPQIAQQINNRWPHPRARLTKNAVIARARKLELCQETFETKPGVVKPRKKAKGEI